MKDIKDYITESVLSIFEVSSELMKRAAEKQRKKLEDEEYLNTITAKKYQDLKKRAEKFEEYAKERYKDEITYTKKRVEMWLDPKRYFPNFNAEIEIEFKITPEDKLRGMAYDWLDPRGNETPPIDLSKVTKIIVLSCDRSRVDSTRCFTIIYDCNGKYGVEQPLITFFEKIGDKTYTIKNLNLLKEMYEWALSHIESKFTISDLHHSGVEDILNNFDDKDLGNKNGKYKLSSDELYNLLIGSGCYYGTAKQKEKYLDNKGRPNKWEPNPPGNLQWYYHKRDWLMNFLDLDVKYDNIFDIKRKIRDQYDNFNNIKDINLTDVANSRGNKAWRTLIRCAMLYLCDKILKNDVSKVSEKWNSWGDSYETAKEYMSITAHKQLTHNDLKDWMQTFGLTPDKVHINGQTIRINRKDFMKDYDYAY